ncbi:MAG: uroporphyrinogen decarboxylase family protein [Pseudomonadota bacterium]
MANIDNQARPMAPGAEPGRDGVRVSPFIGGYAARLMGIPLQDYYSDPALAVRAQMLTRALHGHDDPPSFGWADWGAWEFGGRIRFPHSDGEAAPSTAESPVKKPSDVDRLPVPDPKTAGWFPLIREYNRLMVGLGFPPRVKGGAVTNVVAAMLGRENLLRWYLREPEAVKVAYEKASDLIISAADTVIAEFGPEFRFGYGAPLDANDLVSPRIFEKFSWPYLKKVHQAMLDRGASSFNVHICGDHRKNLAAWAALPWPPGSVVSIGADMDLVETAEAFSHKHIIAGNVSTTILAEGGYDDVTAAARRCVEIGRTLPGGFMLTPACEMPVLTPPLNVHALLTGWKESERH